MDKKLGDLLSEAVLRRCWRSTRRTRRTSAKPRLFGTGLQTGDNAAAALNDFDDVMSDDEDETNLNEGEEDLMDAGDESEPDELEKITLCRPVHARAPDRDCAAIGADGGHTYSSDSTFSD